MEDNCFTILHWFLPYNNMNWLKYTYAPSLSKLLPSPHPIQPLWVSREQLVELPVLYSNFPLAICFTYGNVCFDATFSIHPTLSFPCCAHKSVPYVCISILALKICCSVSFSRFCLILCDPMGCITPDFLVHHQLPELVQTHVHRVSDAIQPFHPLSTPSPPAFNLLDFI